MSASGAPSKTDQPLEPDDRSPADDRPGSGDPIDAPVAADGSSEIGESEGAEGGEPFLPLARRGGVLLRQDLLSRYLADVQRFERLSAEEEHELAVRWRVDGDAGAAQRLVTSHLRLVVAIALSFRRAFSNVLDLIQEGNVGLMEAVRRFDPLKGTRLSTYATWWIRSRMVRYLLDNWRLVRVGTTNARRKLLYNLRDEKERLTAMGITPTPKLLADNLGTSTEDVVAVSRALGAADLSLSAPLGADGTPSREDLLPGAGRSPEAELAGQLLLERLHAVLDAFEPSLNSRERAILRERLLAEEPVTLQQLASREDVSREALRQSEQRLLDKLRRHLSEELPEAARLDLLHGPG